MAQRGLSWMVPFYDTVLGTVFGIVVCYRGVSLHTLVARI